MAFNQDKEMKLWKDEPVSPSGSPLLKFDDDDLVFFNDTSLEFFNNAAEAISCDDPLNRALIAARTIDEIEMEGEFIKEESFSAWMEQRTYIPIYEEYNLTIAPEDGNNDIGYQPDVLKPHLQQEQQQDSTQTLLQEFETVLGDVEACHQIIPPTSSALTPPQSPPPPPPQQQQQPQQNVDTQLLITLQPAEQSPLFSGTGTEAVYNTVVSVDENPLFANDTPRQWDTENIPLSSLDGDVANELAVVEEYVRSHAKDIPSPSSPCTSSGSSSISTEDVIDDPDWTLENEKDKPSTSRNPYKIYHQRSRPSIEDKKVRKKEQNKNAATRYRQKKKQEIKEILSEERELTDINEKLKSEIVELERNIKYTKGLMRDLFKAKGIFR